MSVIYLMFLGLALGFVMIMIAGRHPVPILREDGTDSGGTEQAPDKSGYRHFATIETYAEAVRQLVVAQGMNIDSIQRAAEDEFEIHASIPSGLVSGKVILHCRYTDEPVTAERVEELKTSVRGERGLKGIFITTDYFTADVHKIVEGSPIEFVNIEKLTQLLDEHGIPSE